MTDVDKKQPDTLTEAINTKYREVEGLARSTVEAGIELGRMLVEKRESLDHGEWGPWLKEHFEGSRSHAYNFMGLYENRNKLPGGNVQHVGRLSLRDALKAIANGSTEESDPFEEVLGYVEAEMNRLAAMDVSTELVKTKDEAIEKINHHHRKAQQSFKQVGKHYLETLKHIKAMCKSGHDSPARGWLREVLISMSINCKYPGGLYGVLYRGVVCDVREGLLKAVADEDLRQEIETRLEWSGRFHGTVTFDLTDEETMLAKAFFGPGVLEDVAKSLRG